MQTIITKYLPATNHLPVRVKAQTSSGSHSITLSTHSPKLAKAERWSHIESLAAQILIKEKLNDSWRGTWKAGKIDSNRTAWTNVSTPVQSFFV